MDLLSALLIPEGENKKHLYAQNVNLSGIKTVPSLIPDSFLLIDLVGIIKTVKLLINKRREKNRV